MTGLEEALRLGLRQAFAATLTAADLVILMKRLSAVVLLPLAWLGAALLGATILLQMLSTSFGFSLAKLGPRFDRLNPAARLKQLPGNNFVNFLQAAILIPLMLWLTWQLVEQRMADILRLPLLPVAASASAAGELVRDCLRKAAFVLMVLGSILLFRERARYNARLRMTKQEVKDELRENEGNPQTKARVRRIQRDLRRRNMMREVPKATAVVVNPTHYAVALRYDQGSMKAPEVVAKGKNYLAARIRALATENQVPIIENPPLAQTLYKAVDIGQEIPPQLYRAVAEILAYVFQLMKPLHAAGRTR
jgi:flagellar biosynthetic protein FlhB